MTIKRVIFVRPGETDWNFSERWQGWLDVPLNTHGKHQVERLATLMRNISLGVLYSSDLRRAVETAEVIGRYSAIAPKIDARLRERNIGSWQGLRLDEVAVWFPEEFAAYMANRMNFQFPNGESLTQVQIRMKEAFEDILKENAAETVAIVSHTVSIRVLLAHLIEGYDPITARLGNSSVTTIERTASGWRIVVPNDVTHLEGLESRIVNEMEDKLR
ncbi:MAG: histidine phosphatase family protein [Chloroflexi bacterium]|nr:histidine phosphatase family protein [Chloroflexota bacterium]